MVMMHRCGPCPKWMANDGRSVGRLHVSNLPELIGKVPWLEAGCAVLVAFLKKGRSALTMTTDAYNIDGQKRQFTSQSNASHAVQPLAFFPQGYGEKKSQQTRNPTGKKLLSWFIVCRCLQLLDKLGNLPHMSAVQGYLRFILRSI